MSPAKKKAAKKKAVKKTPDTPQKEASKKNGNGNGVISIPPRRMTQAELDTFLEKAANILRGNVDHSEFRGYVFALLFFKRISDVFEEDVRKLEKELGDVELAHDPAMQKQMLHFVVPKDCTWSKVVNVASTKLGQSLNDAMLAIERANAPKFDGILTNKIDFNKQDELPRGKLVSLKNHFSSKVFDRAHVPDDVFGDAYEYLIRAFASKAGKSSGEFYTPREVSYLMSEIIEPKEGHEICDWAAGSGSLLLQCREYLKRTGKDPNQLFLFAQESNVATHNISRINMILHGINSWNPEQGDSLREPKHLTGNQLKQFDRVVMNPPFSLEDWGYDDFTDGDPYDRFGYAMPPAGNGDYAWLMHVMKSLKSDGKAIIVMSQGILFRGQPELTEEEDGRNKKADDEYLIRRGFLKDKLIEGVIVLPSGIFYGNNVPACLVILNKKKPKSRHGKVLMIWASRDFKPANPQNILRRADCLRILVAWKAFGDIEKACKLIPIEGKKFLDAIETERSQMLQEVRDAYDPILEQLPNAKKQMEAASVESYKAWQVDADASHSVWGELAQLTQAMNQLVLDLSSLSKGDPNRKTKNDELKKTKSELRSLTKEIKDKARNTTKKLKALIKALEKNQKEKDLRIASIEKRLDRETTEVKTAIAQMQQSYTDAIQSSRYFVLVEKSEIEENEFNLNVPRYVDTFEPEEEIDLAEMNKQLQAAHELADKTNERLKEALGKLA